jgi:hypothetical protein
LGGAPPLPLESLVLVAPLDPLALLAPPLPEQPMHGPRPVPCPLQICTPEFMDPGQAHASWAPGVQTVIVVADVVADVVAAVVVCATVVGPTSSPPAPPLPPGATCALLEHALAIDMPKPTAISVIEVLEGRVRVDAIVIFSTVPCSGYTRGSFA